MFIGHFAVGLGSKKFAPRVPLPVLLIAALLPDLLWSTFLLWGWERVRLNQGNTRFTPVNFIHIPWSHSLVMDLLWAGAFALVYYRITRYRPGTIAVFTAVLSHWVLDFISHRPDLPLYPSGPRLGLGLWNSVETTMVLEIGMLLAGAWLYFRATRGRDVVGRYGAILFVATLLTIYLIDYYDGTTENMADLAWSGLLGSVTLLVWAWWVDRRRVLRAPQAQPDWAESLNGTRSWSRTDQNPLNGRW
jgi:membrane-bound metal-dependent hydrolase YbcI (DUF457 family)